jgi:hypothetical protein
MVVVVMVVATAGTPLKTRPENDNPSFNGLPSQL